MWNNRNRTSVIRALLFAAGSLVPASHATAESGRPGLRLDVYVTQPTDVRDIPLSIPPVESGIVDVPREFQLSAYRRVGTMGSQDVSGQSVGLQWSGLFDAQASGTYDYMLTVKVDRESGAEECVGIVKIDNQDVIRLVSIKNTGGFGDYKERTHSGNGSADLSSGKHLFSFWAYCNGQRAHHDRIHFQLLAKGPEERAMRPLTPALFSAKD